MFITPNERKVRIEVGYGLKPVITDSKEGEIIREKIILYVKEGNYDKGVESAVKEIESLISKNYNNDNLNKDNSSLSDVLFLLIVFIAYLIYNWLIYRLIKLGLTKEAKGRCF